jgi:O-antigen/teichoic acid export membrane protein
MTSRSSLALRRLMGAVANQHRVGSLGARASVSASWRVAGHIGGTFVRLAGNLVMTRLLAPESFGLMAFVFTLHAGLVMLTDIGLRVSVMRSTRGDEPNFLRTAWTLQAIQFAVLSVGLGLFGGLLALVQANGKVSFANSVYGDTEAPALIIASALVLIAQGLQSMNLALAERRMRIGRLTLIEFGGQIAATAIMIAFAMADFGVWSLMIGAVAGQGLRTLASHLVLEGPRMGLRWSRDEVDEIWRFGRWLIGASTLGFIGTQGDKLILGALLDATTFGLYAIATIWITAARDAIAKATQPTGLAVFSEVVRLRPDELGVVFSRFRRVQDALCGAAFLGAILVGPPVLLLIYPDTYAGSGLIIALLSFQLLAQRYAPFTALLLQVGESRSVAAVAAVLCIGMLAVPLGTYHTFGFEWAIVAVAMNHFWTLPSLLWRSAAYVKFSLNREVLEALLFILVSIACAFLLIEYGLPLSPWIAS